MDRYETQQLGHLEREVAGMSSRLELLEELRAQRATSEKSNHETRIEQLEDEVEALTETCKRLVKAMETLHGIVEGAFLG
jgi:hypothetical protein